MAKARLSHARHDERVKVWHRKVLLLDVPAEIGGARRDRTADPLLAKQVLSQLSYGPIEGSGGSGWI